MNGPSLLVDILAGDGVVLTRAAGTHGGEYAGPCPFCGGGKDRFRVWPFYKGGRWWCRVCDKAGDAVQYLREAKGMSYREAYQSLGMSPRDGRRSSMSQQPAAFHPRDGSGASAAWVEKAEGFVKRAETMLWSGSGAGARRFLEQKGLVETTIRQARIGWNGSDTYADREAWGLPKAYRPDGKPKGLWIPSGLVIPCVRDGQAVRVRVRRHDPGDGPRYVVVAGSDMRPLVLGLDLQPSSPPTPERVRNRQGGQEGAMARARPEPPAGRVVVVVESELDGWLVYQEGAGLVGVMALGSASNRPDRRGDEALQKASAILVALDADETGMKQSWNFWRSTYGQKARRWPVPIGKDPSDAWAEGMDIRAWIQAGIQA